MSSEYRGREKGRERGVDRLLLSGLVGQWKTKKQAKGRSLPGSPHPEGTTGRQASGIWQKGEKVSEVTTGVQLGVRAVTGGLLGRGGQWVSSIEEKLGCTKGPKEKAE